MAMTCAPRPAPASPFVARSLFVSVLMASAALAACQRAAPPGAIDAGEVRHALDVLAAAPSQGFASDFHAAEIDKLGDKDHRAQRDSLLRASVLAYARAEHGLTLPAKARPPEWGDAPPAYDAEADMTKAIADHRFKAWLDGLAPAAPEYQALQKAYVAYAKAAADGGWPTVPGPLRAGARGLQVAALRQRLAAEDAAVQAQGPAQGDVFDAPLTAAVQRAQAAYGLPATGVVDAATLKALNVPAAARAAQLRASLERLRWLPREVPATRVDVNTAAATFDYLVDGKPALHMLAAPGKPGDETPMLTSAIDAVVLDPPWNVPDGIAKDELYPKEAAQPGYFAAHNFQVVDGRLQQKPGPDSSLGLVKFDFKNPYAVYLHDTPSKAAFSRTQRAVSHGCVRLQAAVQFAKVLLAKEAGWSEQRVDAVIAKGDTTQVKLQHKVPVRLMYLTAFADGGRIAFRPDVYGWDGDLLRRLDAAPVGGGARAANTTGPRREASA